jgi:hypothetical protein
MHTTDLVAKVSIRKDGTRRSDDAGLFGLIVVLIGETVEGGAASSRLAPWHYVAQRSQG